MDFALIIVVLTALAGVIWAFDALFFARARVAAALPPCGTQVKPCNAAFRLLERDLGEAA